MSRAQGCRMGLSQLPAMISAASLLFTSSRATGLPSLASAMGSNMGSPVRTQRPEKSGGAVSEASALFAAATIGAAADNIKPPAMRLKAIDFFDMSAPCLLPHYTGSGHGKKTGENQPKPPPLVGYRLRATFRPEARQGAAGTMTGPKNVSAHIAYDDLREWFALAERL